MSTCIAFMKKEWMEYIKTSKLTIIGIIFIVFGLMNPAMAKLTPFIMEKYAASQENGSVQIIINSIDATMSWTQFFKNAPMALLIIIVLFGGILTNELQKGTLIPVLTKGVSRWTIFLTKGINILIIWTVGYFMCYGITYFYNDYYWDNSIMTNLLFATICYWIFGCFIICLMMFFSALSGHFSGVMLGLGAVYFILTILSIAEKIKYYLPLSLTGYTAILNGANPDSFYKTIGITGVLSILCIILGGLSFQKKEM